MPRSDDKKVLGVVFEGLRKLVRVLRGAAIVAIAAPLVIAPLNAEARPRQAAMVLDANTGRIIHNSQGDNPVYPASLTKMMTLYMVFEQIEAGRLKMSSSIRMSETAASVAPSKLGLDPGETIALDDAIKAVITKSANDVATALAETIGGTEENFAELMTAKARALGMTNTKFRNASGLPDPRQTTTARDMITLALRLQDDFPQYYSLFSTRTFTHRGDTHRNHNTLLFHLPGTDGIKTGYTRASGFNLVSSVKRDGKHLVAAVFGGASAGSRNAHMKMLLYRAFSKASTEKTRKPMLVAKLKAPPKIAERKPKREEPRVTDRLPPPGPARRPEPRVEPVRPAAEPVVATPPQIAEPAIPQPPPLNIQIAQVKRVEVAPRLKRPEPGPDETTDMPPAALEPEFANPNATAKFDFKSMRVNHDMDGGAAPDSSAPAASIETIISKATPGEQRPRSLAPDTPQTVEALIEAAAADPALNSEDIKVAAAPSVTPQEPAMKLNGPADASSARRVKVGGDYQIQIGAYESEKEAEKQMASVTKRAGPMLADYRPATSRVRKGQKQMYRARFTGFEANAASKACLELRRLAVDCFVMRAE